VVRQINYISHFRNKTYDVVPEDERALLVLYALAKGRFFKELRDWVDEDYSNSRVFIELSDFSSCQIEEKVAEVYTLVKELFPAGTHYYKSGSTYQMAVMNQ
jgi:hypothetical protein